MKTLKVTVKPKGPNALQEEDYRNFINGVGSLTKGQKLLVCVMMYQILAVSGDWYDGQFEMETDYLTQAGAILLACLQLAGLATQSQPRLAATSNKCGQALPSLPASLTKTSNGYHLSASGTPVKAKKPKLRIRCKQSGDTLRYTIRSAKKGQPLQKAAGAKLMVGLKSPQDAQTTVPVKVTFARG